MLGNRRTVLVLTLAAALLGAAALGGMALLGSDRDEATWDYFRVEQDELLIFRTVRACDHVVSADVQETTDRVTVALQVEHGGVCGDLAVDKSATVTLKDPLRDRPVYDAVCLDGGNGDQECLRSVPDQGLR